MTKQLCLNFGVALLAVTSVYAQESRILANVPFGFYAGTRLLPSASTPWTPPGRAWYG